MNHLLEDTIVEALVCYLRDRNWTIKSYCTGRSRGVDICAEKSGKQLMVEAKGGKGNPNQHSVVRDIFDKGQIRDHLGKAIVKVLELKIKYPDSCLLIAHPHSEPIREIVDPVATELRAIGINFCFYHQSGEFEFLADNPNMF